jgi:hypothetical protein
MTDDADGDFTPSGSPFPVRVDGLGRAVSQLRKLGVDMGDMSATMHAVGEVVVQATHLPKRTGKLAATLRAGKGKTKAVVKIGSARIAYGGLVEYMRGKAPSGAYLNKARDSHRAEILSTFQAGIQTLIENNGLSAD